MAGVIGAYGGVGAGSGVISQRSGPIVRNWREHSRARGRVMAEPNGVVDTAVAAASAGGGFAGVLLASRWLLHWITGRYDKRAERIDAKDDKVDLQWPALREAYAGDNGSSETRRVGKDGVRTWVTRG